MPWTAIPEPSEEEIALAWLVGGIYNSLRHPAEPWPDGMLYVAKEDGDPDHTGIKIKNSNYWWRWKNSKKCSR